MATKRKAQPTKRATKSQGKKTTVWNALGLAETRTYNKRSSGRKAKVRRYSSGVMATAAGFVDAVLTHDYAPSGWKQTGYRPRKKG